MKYIYLTVVVFALSFTAAYAQMGKQVQGVVVDTANVTQPGTNIKLISDLGDSTATLTDVDGKFTFTNVKGKKIKLYVSSLGFQPIIKNYTLPDTSILILPNVVLHTLSNTLKEVVIVGVNPVKFKEDTVEYKVAAYKVRENAPVEDVIKKLPGVEVDANGNVTAQGKSVTKVRINGKDFMGGDLQAATKNLPADIIEGIQIIDDYGDQANLTGVRTGDPQKILNLTIRADKNYGYTVQATGGVGRDMLPAAPGVTNATRYLGTVNAFNFKGDRQITVLGNINNTNVNTFSFSGGGGGGRGGRGGGGFNTGLATVADGITDAHSIGLNYRDQWDVKTAVYGSYSYSNNQTQINESKLVDYRNSTPTSNSTESKTFSHPVNQRAQFNIEWKPDTINYLKVTPTFTSAQNNGSSVEHTKNSINNTPNTEYDLNDVNNSTSNTFGLTALFNHRFTAAGRNLSINVVSSLSQNNSYDNPLYKYSFGKPTAPLDQRVNSDNKTRSISANLSYLEPIGKVSYLELTYAYSHSYTSNDKETDTLSTAGTLNNVSNLSNNYNFTFNTNKVGLNYRVVEAKYNLTLGVGLQPTVLDGYSVTTGRSTHVSQLNFVPTARYNYTVSRTQSFNVIYNGSSDQPSFTQLQPVPDFTNPLYPTVGNPDLKPSFTNSFRLRYNNYGIATGNIFFFNATYSTISNQVVSSTTTYAKTLTSTGAAAAALDPAYDARFLGTNVTRYLNSDGYSTASGQITYSKPWSERKYTLSLQGRVDYTNSTNYSASVDQNYVSSGLIKNSAKTLTLTPGMRFRVDITDVVDLQAITNYAINSTKNSVTSALYSANQNIRTWVLGLSGKNFFFTDWTLGYDYTKQINYGYASNVQSTNPNILNLYVERRFLKDNRATLRFATFDVFNQNTGFSLTTNGNITTQSNVNRLGRYFLATLAIRLQKFAGKEPTPERRFEGGAGGPGGRDRGGFGGPRGD